VRVVYRIRTDLWYNSSNSEAAAAYNKVAVRLCGTGGRAVRNSGHSARLLITSQRAAINQHDVAEPLARGRHRRQVPVLITIAAGRSPTADRPVNWMQWDARERSGSFAIAARLCVLSTDDDVTTPARHVCLVLSAAA